MKEFEGVEGIKNRESSLFSAIYHNRGMQYPPFGLFPGNQDRRTFAPRKF